jgi:hypothetical protein
VRYVAPALVVVTQTDNTGKLFCLGDTAVPAMKEEMSNVRMDRSRNRERGGDVLARRGVDESPVVCSTISSVLGTQMSRVDCDHDHDDGDTKGRMRQLQ